MPEFFISLRGRSQRLAAVSARLEIPGRRTRTDGGSAIQQTGSLRSGGTGEMRPGPRASMVLSCCGSGAGLVGATGVKPPREAAADHSRVRFLCVVPEGHPRIAQRLSVGALGGAPSHPGGNALDRRRRVRISQRVRRTSPWRFTTTSLALGGRSAVTERPPGQRTQICVGSLGTPIT